MAKHPSGRIYLEEWMAFRGISDEAMAKRLEVARETVTRYRNQPHRINTPKQAAIARVLDITPGELWDPPGAPSRPSVDAILKDVPDDVLQHAIEYATIIAKRGR